MGTDWKLKPRPLRPLTPAILRRLNDLVLLDDEDDRDARKAAKMHQEIRRALEAYPHQHVWMDRARPANQLRGLAQFKKRLVALIDVFDDLDDVTWQDIDMAHEPGSADNRLESSVRLALDRIAAAVAAVQDGLKRAKQPASSQHRPTTEARRELVKELVSVFAKYAPKKSKSPKDERTELLKFVQTILKAVGVPSPKHAENFRALINRELRSVSAGDMSAIIASKRTPR